MVSRKHCRISLVIIFFGLLLIQNTSVFAQVQVVDSLEALLIHHNNKDTNRVNILTQLAYKYRTVDREKLFEFARQANVLSDSLNYDTGRLNSLNLLGLYFWSISDYQKALNLYEQALDIAVSIGNSKGQSECLYYIGNVYREKGDYAKTLQHHLKALDIQKNIGDSSGIARIYNSIGIVYRIQGDYPKALDYCQKSLRIKEQIGDKTELSTVYNNIGSVYYFQNNYPKTLEYYNKSLKISEESNDKIAIVTSYNNIGIVYFYQDDYEKALDFFQRALSIQEEIDDKTGKAISYINIGEIYVKQNDYDNAWKFYSKGLELSIVLGIKSVEGWSNWGLGVISSKKQRINEAYTYTKKAYDIGEKTGEIELIQQSSEILSKIAASLGMFQEAYKFHKIYKVMSDSIQNKENTRKIIGLEYEYKYEKDKEEQEKREAVQLAKYQRQKFITIIFIVSFSLMVVLVVIVLRNYKRKQQDYKTISEQKEEIRSQNESLQLWNKEVSAQNKKINLQKKQLEEQALKLKQLDEIKSRFFTNISHEFRTPLTLIIGPVEQLLLTVKDKNVKESLNLMLRNAQKLLELINQLLEISKIEKGNIKLKFQQVDIKNEIQYKVEMFSSLANEKKLDLNFKTDNSDFNGYIDKEKFDKIIMNLLSNSFKHTKKGNISIDLRKSTEPGKILITISDTGIGIKKEKLPYIFDRFYQVENHETKEIVGTGIGLSFTKELIKLYKGEITAQSEPGKGTQLIINLPVSLDYYTENEYELVTDKITSPDSIITNTELTEKQPETSNKECPDKNSETILVVEDHTDLRKFIAKNLSDCYRIIEASNGKEGIEKALKNLPDIIITDIMMPEVDGIELTKTLKFNENTSHIPIVMLTAKSSSESRIEGLETEADDYLTKPFNIKELQTRINNLVKIRKKLQEKYHRSISVNPSEITTTSVDERFISKLLKIIEENMVNTDFSVEILCDLAGMSRANIHKKLKSLLNQSATEFINSIRLKRAAQLIKQNAGNISEIAYDVGFNNLSYFSRAFKNHFNITPREMMENKDN